MTFDMYRFILEKEIEEIDNLEESGVDLRECPDYKRDNVLYDRKGRLSYFSRRNICKSKLAKHLKKIQLRDQ